MKTELTKAQKPFFLWLVPLFFVFHGYVQNWNLVPAADALLLICFYIVAATVLLFLFRLIFKSLVKAALYTGLLLATHFFFGAVHDALKIALGERFVTSYSFLLPAIGLLWLMIGGSLFRTRISLYKPVRFLNLLLVVLLMVDAGFLLGKSLSVNRPKLPAGLTSFSSSKPDVYLILADGYSGKKELDDIFGFDNRPFMDSLRQMGFYVYDQPKSNYNYTPFSVASTLNFNYLHLPRPANNAPDVPRIMQEVKENKFTNFLVASGYTIFNNSYFDLLNDPTPTAATFLPSKTTYITAQTLLSRMWRDIGFNLVTKYQLDWAVADITWRNKRNNELLYNGTLKTAASSIHPKFSYTHLMLPHPPYYFDKDGNHYSLSEVQHNVSTERYLGYLQYSNTKYLQLVNHILSQPGPKPVIVFMSDHGSRHTEHGDKKEYVFYNFVALYFPARNYQTLPPNISNVNVFRVVLNEVFGQHLPLLKDSTTFLSD